jgi:hypothetical protein
VSSCRELQALDLPSTVVEPVFPPGTAFARLTHLQIGDAQREHPPHAGVMGLWELAASGGLPALAKLRLTLDENQWGTIKEMRTRLAPAFEAVAGTLTHLCLDMSPKSITDTTVAYEFGVADGQAAAARGPHP